jgi:phosphohistidine swiveling domain-containing protein
MSKIPYVLPLDAVTQDQTAVVGGKGLRLAELARAGLPVLPGFCITTAAYRAFIEAGDLLSLLEDGDAAALRERITCAAIPTPIAEAITSAYAGLDGAVAVRSSATGEDSQEASFAGQYATFLNVTGSDAVLDRVRACWASLWGEQALAYMREQAIDPRGVAMGVVVQRLGDAHASGVIFTLNPLTGNEEEMTIEAAWGLGEAVVSGRVTPDRYRVNFIDGEVVSREVANQSVVLVADRAGGVREESLPHERRDTPVLTDEQLLELARLGDEVQILYGHPQDIEWAHIDGQFVLLQARPLTSFAFDPALGQWTSANYREVLPGFACPLTISLSMDRGFQNTITNFLKTIKMGIIPPETPMAHTFFGRIYWNVGVVKRFNALVPGFKERHFDKTVGVEPTYEGDGLSTPWTPRTIIRALPILFALNDQYENAWKEAEVYRDTYYAETEPRLQALDLEALSDAELADQCREMVALHLEDNLKTVSIAFICEQAQEEFEPVIHRLNKRLPPEERIAPGDLITGLQNVATAQPALTLQRLAQQALEAPDVRRAIVEGEPGGIPERLSDSAAGRAFWEQLQAIIKRFHYMAVIDEDLIYPRWDEDPTDALVSLQSYVRVGEQLDPEGQRVVQRRKREEAARCANAALKRGWRRLWFFERRGFFNKLHIVQQYVWWREETRVVASHVFYHCRRVFLEQGRRWARAGILDAADDIFYLRWPAISAVLDGTAPPESLRERVAAYRRLKQRFRNFEPPNVIGLGSSTRRVRKKPGQKVYRGVPCSSGQVEGRARVARTLEEARALEPGEILVARYTNPGWMPLFAVAGGIVIEEGGLLSHGAVVAREYGIPAVLSIEGATRLFETGQRLRIDGGEGTVEAVTAPRGNRLI